MNALTRRASLKLCSAGAAAATVAGASVLAPRALGDEGYTGENAVSDDLLADWMNTWMDDPEETLRAPEGALHLGRFSDAHYFLRRPIAWQPNPGEEPYDRVVVPAGFVTDFASVPRAFFSIWPPNGLYTYPAIIHDYLYWSQCRSREEADDIFWLGMGDFKISGSVRWSIYGPVRSFGWFAWNNNANAKSRGEKRFLDLENLPEDPTMTWEEWRTREGVFADESSLNGEYCPG